MTTWVGRLLYQEAYSFVTASPGYRFDPPKRLKLRLSGLLSSIARIVAI